MTLNIKTKARRIAADKTDVRLQGAVANAEMEFHYQHLVEARNNLIQKILVRTKKNNLDGWIVCGSGLAGLPNAKGIEILDRILVEKIPNWFSPQAPGHGRELLIANIKGQLVGIATGRAHIYDTDSSPTQLRMITDPLVVAKGLGINWLLTTNAAGVIDNGKVKIGDVIVDIDYVNQHGVNPLIGPNDERLGQRFPGKSNVADPYLYARLEELIPSESLHLGIYTLSSNAPFYEGRGDLINGIYNQLIKSNPDLVQCFGMSFAMDAMIMQHCNNPSIDPYGFDRQVRWIGLTAATNVIPSVTAPTKKILRKTAISNPNPTSHKEVLQGGIIAEKLFIPAVIGLCDSLTNKPLPIAI